MHDRGDDRPVRLFYANPTWEEASVREELDELSVVMDLEVVHVLEDPPDGWEGATWLLTVELLAQYLPDRASRFSYFVRGPDPMMAAVEGTVPVHDEQDYEHVLSNPQLVDLAALLRETGGDSTTARGQTVSPTGRGPGSMGVRRR